MKSIFQIEHITPLVNTPDELTVIIREVKFTFLYYPYPALKPIVSWPPFNLSALEDIAAMKAQTIGRRGAYKDYFDVYSILQQTKLTLSKIITLAEQKFGDDFNGRIFLEQLLYHDDITDTKITVLTHPVPSDEVYQFLKDAVSTVEL